MTVRAVRNKVQLLSVEQKGRFAIVKEFAVMSVEDCAMKNNATKIKLVPIYTFFMSSIHARTVRNEIQLLSVEQKGRFGHS